MIKWQLLDLTRVLLQPSPAQSASPPLGPQSMAVSAGHLVKTSVSPHSDLPPLTIRLLMQGKVGPRCSAVKLWPYPPYPYPYPSTPTQTTCILSSCERTQHLTWHETQLRQCMCPTPTLVPDYVTRHNARRVLTHCLPYLTTYGTDSFTVSLHFKPLI